MSLSAHKDDQMRVFIRFWSDNVPGKPILRHLRLVNDFCSQMLRREYCQANDYVHIPPQYDKEHQRCWMIFDLNVKEPGLDLGRIPLSCFSVTYFGDQAVNFKKINRSVETFSCRYPWGGNDEERLARGSGGQKSGDSRSWKKEGDGDGGGAAQDRPLFADETQRVMAELQARGSSHSETSTPVAGNEIDVDDKQRADQMAEDAKDMGTDDSAKPVIDESGH